MTVAIAKRSIFKISKIYNDCGGREKQIVIGVDLVQCGVLCTLVFVGIFALLDCLPLEALLTVAR